MNDAANVRLYVPKPWLSSVAIGITIAVCGLHKSMAYRVYL